MNHINSIVNSIRNSQGRELLSYIRLCNRTLTPTQLAEVKTKLLEANLPLAN